MSISDPGFAQVLNFGMGTAGQGGAYAALENPAFNRGVNLIAGTIASLPLRTYRKDPVTDETENSTSFLDDSPSGPMGMSPFNWREQVVLHSVISGEVGLPHIHNQAGQLIGLVIAPPTAYIPRWQKGDDGVYHKVFRLTTVDGRQKDWGDGCDNAIEGRCMTQILGPSMDGLRGLSPIWLFRRNLALFAAQEVAAMKMMTSGNLSAGMISPKMDMSKGDAEDIAKSIREGMLGPDKAGAMVLVNKAMDVVKWTQTNTDAQFIEGREFSVSEVARMLGVPTHMLYSMAKDQSFASGLAEQVSGWQKSTLMPITSRIEQALSQLLVKPKYVEFDYKGLLQPVPEIEIKLILQQLDAGIMSEEEARELLGLGPKDSGDTFREPAPVPVSGKLPMEPAPATTGGGNTNGKAPAGMGA